MEKIFHYQFCLKLKILKYWALLSGIIFAQKLTDGEEVSGEGV